MPASDFDHGALSRTAISSPRSSYVSRDGVII
jgi:hypothetical protein